MLTRRLSRYIRTANKKIAIYEHLLINVNNLIAAEDEKGEKADPADYISLVDEKEKIQNKLRKYYHIKKTINDSTFSSENDDAASYISPAPTSIYSEDVANLPNSPSVLHKILAYTLMQMPAIFDTVASVAELAVGIKQMGDENYQFLDVIPVSDWFQKMLPPILLTTYSIYIWNLTAEYVTDNIDDVMEMIKKRQFPRETTEEIQEWPVLPPRREKMAIALMLIPALYPIFCNAAATVRFASHMPEELEFSDAINTAAWNVFCGFLTVPIAISTAISVSKSVYQASRKLFIQQPDLLQEIIDEKSFILKWLSKIFSFLLGGTGFSQGIIEMYYVVGLTLHIESREGRSTLLAATILLYGIPESCLPHATGVHALKELFNKIATGFNRKELLAFMTSSLFSVFIAEALRKFFVEMLDNPEMEFPFSLPQPLISTFGVGVFTYEMIRSTTYSYSFFYQLPEKLKSAGSFLKNTMSMAGNAIYSGFTSCKRKSMFNNNSLFYQSMNDNDNHSITERTSYSLS